MVDVGAHLHQVFDSLAFFIIKFPSDSQAGSVKAVNDCNIGVMFDEDLDDLQVLKVAGFEEWRCIVGSGLVYLCP